LNPVDFRAWIIVQKKVYRGLVRDADNDINAGLQRDLVYRNMLSTKPLTNGVDG
jgi:hypothetical protein